MFTSNFATAKRIQAERPDLRLVSIAVGTARWFRGDKEPRLAPTRPMLKLGRADYDREYDVILARVEPADILAKWGPDAVLLCWEKANVYCHRRRVAEWIEAALGIEVPEYGHSRQDTPAYHALPVS